MKKYGRDNRPHLKPVTRIELSEKNVKLRKIAAVLLFVIGMAGIMIALISMLNTQPGWQQIEVSSDRPNCSSEFTLMYDFTDYGGSATAANRQLNQLYTQATEDAYKLFSSDVEEEGLHNVRYVNSHINEAVTVDPVLYEAFTLIDAYRNRSIYLAPVYAEYDRVFLCENSAEAKRYDPAYNAELIPYITEAAGFANDPEMIRVELLGENQVCLRISEEYLAFAETYQIDTFLDFSWLKNAFIADYIADLLSANGFTCGYLSSYDGFTRNLDTRGNSFSVNIFDRQENLINMPARMNYSGPLSIVFLRDYSMTELDRWHYFTYENGETTTVYLDSADGMSRSAIDSLLSYSENTGCAEILLQMIPVYIAEEFDAGGLHGLTADGIYSIWCENSSLYHNDPAVMLELQEDSSGKTYSKKLTDSSNQA